MSAARNNPATSERAPAICQPDKPHSLIAAPAVDQSAAAAKIKSRLTNMGALITSRLGSPQLPGISDQSARVDGKALRSNDSALAASTKRLAVRSPAA